MQRLVYRCLPPAIFLASAMLCQLPASTFGGSTGPRQNNGEDPNLPKVMVDSNTYRRTKVRLSMENAVPISLPSGSYIVRKNSESIVEYNNSFVLVTRD